MSFHEPIHFPMPLRIQVASGEAEESAVPMMGLKRAAGDHFREQKGYRKARRLATDSSGLALFC